MTLRLVETAAAPHPPSGVEKHLRASVEAKALAMELHAIDIRLGRARPQPFTGLSLDEQRQRFDRAALAIRLGDPTVLPVAIEHASRALRSEHARVPDRTVARSLALTATRAVLEHLKGYIGGAAW
jgi:hypothetical protein